MLADQLNSRPNNPQETPHNLIGIDADPKMIAIARQKRKRCQSMNELRIDYIVGDFFQEFGAEVNKNSFDIILGNPPHAARYSKHQWNIIQSNFPNDFGVRLPKESAIYFTKTALMLLKKGGKLAFILPKPLIYSQRWNVIRKLILAEYNLLKVIDFGNQFKFQNQEHIGIIISKKEPDSSYLTGIYEETKQKFQYLSTIMVQDALLTDNFLVGVSKAERRLIRRLYGPKYQFLDVEAFRGISSRYRVFSSGLPLVEKKTMERGFLAPSRSFIFPDTPKKILKRYQQPKIIMRRILSYSTRPYRFFIHPWVDINGNIISHETTINIINPKPKYSLNFLAALFQSSLTEWWLRHVVFTKRFATSKDFDRAYVQKVRIPRFEFVRYKFESDTIKMLLREENYESMLELLQEQEKIDLIFLLGQLYEHFITCGEKIKTIIHDILVSRKPDYENHNQFKDFNGLYRRISKGQNYRSDIPETIQKLLNKQDLLQLCIDEATYKHYQLTEEESSLIKVAR